MRKNFLSACLIGTLLAGTISHYQANAQAKTGKSYSGIYPHLAMYNNEGECGTGAVVPWAGKLWAVTYGPHLPFGSSDKLYEITPDLKQIVHPESIGGTPANRMIHPESNQLFIGPYAIDAQGNVRVMPYKTMPGRHTGNARHLTDPTGKIYYGTMEEGFYEVDVKTLTPTLLYEDGNVKTKKGADESNNHAGALLPGAHGKGLYSGQGVLVYSNNGEPGPQALKQFDIEAGSLSEWNGKDWKVVRRNQFVEVTGPGGIYGNKNPATDPIWATGWDHKSVLLGVRDAGKWSFFRLPKASHSYDGAHGWNTEWPRIRDVGTAQKPDYLMTMHGLFWRFPGQFSASNTAGIRPRSAYLKVIGDYTRWNDQLVFGCDDSAQKEFLNKRGAKGNIEGPGQSNSNLWFTSTSLPDQLGPNTAEGAVWLNETVRAAEPSEPFLFAGWPNRSAWVQNNGDADVSFSFEVDKTGNGTWTALKTVKIAPKSALNVEFAADAAGEWIRIRPDKATTASAHFFYSANDTRTATPNSIFAGLSSITSTKTAGGLIYGLGDNRRVLGMAAQEYTGGQPSEVGYYELDGDMKLIRKADDKAMSFIKSKFAIPQKAVTVEESSVLVVDDKGRRWRLPLGHDAYTGLTNQAALRICREVATERDLFNCHGTFYELPAENADGYAKIRPVSSHNLRINDYASYRGLLVMTGVNPQLASRNEHIVVSDDQKAAVWAGAIDDLWKLGKPTGHGGPWKNTAVKANEFSDPFLIGFYDRRSLRLSHTSTAPVTFTIEVDPVGNGPWMVYKEVTVAPGQPFNYAFPKSFQARWIRFKCNKDSEVTAFFQYQ
ncbi:hypothetical protein GCM10028803_40960 [Larkinella knui]|uniref:Uncharacterized protein n=1 Tax=Larkinella knui TaxID=2025310 RepID=A0A3P1CN93_9BACT|nr:hypothetical protein [Larkinella knui]RRB14729.1 hypothetical protein EHT87_09160 [Larkinella knui]